MRDELRNKVYDFFKRKGIGAWNSEYQNALIENLIEVIKSERKKWAISKKPKEQPVKMYIDEFNAGYNQALEDWEKKLINAGK